jgi:hypothetical protein
MAKKKRVAKIENYSLPECKLLFRFPLLEATFLAASHFAAEYLRLS